jgi:hypothetical protein
MQRKLLVLLALVAAGPANAAIIERGYTLTASNFVNFSGDPSPVQTLSVAFRVQYDDAISGFQGAPASFSSTTNGVANVGPFSATPTVGYFPANSMSLYPRLGIGGALNGGNVLLNGTDDFFFTFDASAQGSTPAMLSFTSASFRTPFSATNAVVSPDAVAAVPEPTTWAMVLLGFGAVGCALRRRRSERGAYA